VKLVAVADTHTDYEKLIVPDGDVFIQAGDIDLYTLRDAVRYNKWLGTLPHERKFVVGGNHDKWLAETSLHQKRDVLSNANYLENSSVVFNGIKFWGSPMTPTFYDWFFMADRGEPINRYWDMIPEDTDVVITHGPPKRILDAAPRGIGFDYVGCSDLLERLKIVKPIYHIFGHIHFSYGTETKHGTRFYNVSVMNEEYQIVNEPTQIIITKGDRA
jgi:Icc-related predicted phosphoesterase